MTARPIKAAPFLLGVFLSRWSGSTRHDLAASDCETLTLDALLRMAGPEDLAAWRALDFSYADPHGAPGLRALIAARHLSLQADDVLCCAGAQEAATCAIRAVLTAADHAVIVLPIYQPLEQAVTTICSATGVPLDCERGVWRLDLDRVAAAVRPNTRLLLVNFPNSPTGAAIDADTLAGLVSLCRRRGIWLVNDEIYRQSCVEPASLPAMVADAYERGISVSGLSKSFGLPGLRVGWLACRDRAVLAGALLAKTMLSSCLSRPGEVLAQVALRAEARIVGRTRAIGQDNRRRLLALFERLADVFEADRPASLGFAYPRYLGPEGADRFSAGLAAASILLPAASLWRSPLAALPMDRVRISLGHVRVAPALEALEQHVRGARQPGPPGAA